jgi:hypothetical protein
MLETAGRQTATPPALAFGPPEAESAATVPVALELVPEDVLVFWESERTDQYKRVVALVMGNKLKLVKVTVGRNAGMDILCETALVDEPATLRTQFLSRDTLIFWVEPREPRGLGKTIVLRVGGVLKMVRVTGDEAAPAIEILGSLRADG